MTEDGELTFNYKYSSCSDVRALMNTQGSDGNMCSVGRPLGLSSAMSCAKTRPASTVLPEIA